MPPKKRDPKNREPAEEEAPIEERGDYVFEGGATYSGQVQRRDGVMRRHGQGTFADGKFSYNGAWREDAMHGEGTIEFASGATYTGAIAEGRFDGYGVYTWPDGTRYEGEWRCNRMHGEGTYYEPDGHAWSGRFYNGTGPGLWENVPTVTPVVA
jgi:hypothetical protein